MGFAADGADGGDDVAIVREGISPPEVMAMTRCSASGSAYGGVVGSRMWRDGPAAGGAGEGDHDADGDGGPDEPVSGDGLHVGEGSLEGGGELGDAPESDDGAGVADGDKGAEGGGGEGGFEVDQIAPVDGDGEEEAGEQCDDEGGVADLRTTLQ